MSGDDEGVLAERGFLRVDREKALEKLSQYSLPSPELFLLPWARAAAANGAGHFAVIGSADLQVTFTGPPLSRADLRDPYATLFAGGQDPRMRHVALGLLAVLPTNPSEVVIESGPRERRLRLRVKNVREEALEDAPPGEAWTVVNMRWARPDPLRARSAKAALAEAMVMAPPCYTVDGSSFAPKPDASGAWEVFEREGTRVLLRALPSTRDSSRLTLCSWGVAVETAGEDLGFASVWAWADDPAFSLNASQSGVVRDERFEAAMGVLRDGCRRLVSRALEGLEQHPVLARAQTPEEGDLRAWLLETAVRHKDAAAGDPVVERLLAAPILHDLAGRPLSVRALAEVARKEGQLLWSESDWSGGRLPWTVVRCSERCADALGRLGRAVRVTRLLEGL